jgi:sec-independent protein translocase protein TatA
VRPESFLLCGFSAPFVTHGIEGLEAGAGAPRCYSLSVPFGLQLWEVFLVLLVVLLVFGPKRLPEMGRSLGRGLREFKDSITGKDDDDERAELPPPKTEQPPEEEQPPVAAGTRRDETTP